VKKAHTETVVPVCDADFQNAQKFNNIEDIRKYRNNQNIKPMTTAESKLILNNQTKNEDEAGVKLAYKLAKQDEKTENANNEWWRNLRTIK